MTSSEIEKLLDSSLKAPENLCLESGNESDKLVTLKVRDSIFFACYPPHMLTVYKLIRNSVE